MQAWIPVVSSSSSIVSFRADSILKSDGDFISDWKFPDCVYFFGASARQAVIKTIAVMYELTKRTLEKLFGNWAQQYKAFFAPNQEPASAWIFGNSSVRIGTQGLFHPYLKTLVLPFLPTRLTAPGSPRMLHFKLEKLNNPVHYFSLEALSSSFTALKTQNNSYWPYACRCSQLRDLWLPTCFVKKLTFMHKLLVDITGWH